MPDLDQNYTISSFKSAACQLRILGLAVVVIPHKLVHPATPWFSTSLRVPHYLLGLVGTYNLMSQLFKIYR